MFPLSGQTTGPNGLILMWTLMGSLGVTYANTSASTLYFCIFDGVFVILLLWYTIIIIIIIIPNSGNYKNPSKELSFCHKDFLIPIT